VARIAIGRCGGSLPTRELLDFGRSHAQARDAVSTPFDADRLVDEFAAAGIPARKLTSAAANREDYLRRPDLGRRLSDSSRAELNSNQFDACDLCIVVSDGLSSRATEHALSVVRSLHGNLVAAGWTIAPVQIVPLARVAIQDEIGERLNSTISLILIGERPGLGSPDSLGAYFVHSPKPGRTDADRNCVSNIRPEGLSPQAAVATLQYLLTASRHRKLSGVELKDERILPNGPDGKLETT
jgi:ethanolamine ammonia-lyase small subunit